MRLVEHFFNCVKVSTGTSAVAQDLKFYYSVTDCNLHVLGPLYSQDRILQAMGNVTLSLHLLCERANPVSPWLPYIRSLPQEYDTPLFYEQEEVQLLLGTQAVQDILNQYKNTARQYAYFYKLIQVGNYLEHTHTHTHTHTQNVQI